MKLYKAYLDKKKFYRKLYRKTLARKRKAIRRSIRLLLHIHRSKKGIAKKSLDRRISRLRKYMAKRIGKSKLSGIKKAHLIRKLNR